MPNWCYTNISIYHDNETKLKALYEKIQEWSKTPFKPNGFDEYSMGWLGNIVGNSGVAKWNAEQDCFDGVRTRGSLQSLHFERESIALSTETAWAPMLRMWVLICDKYLPDAQIFFTAEEPGMCIFESNDPDVIGNYYIDVYDTQPDGLEDIDSEYQVSEEYAVQTLQRILQTEEKDIDKLLEQFEETDNEWISIHKWEECSIDNCE